MFELKILVGFLVGTLIGMTGLGGGVLLLPILIYGLHVPAMLAVGSDALFNFITKIGTSWVHLSKGTVRRKVVVALACGSIPGSYGGVAVLKHLRFLYGDGVNSFISHAIGILLICIPMLLLLQGRFEEELAVRQPTAKSFLGRAVLWVPAVFLVGMISVGAAVPVMPRVLIFYSYPPRVMVGTDIVHALFLTGFPSLL